MRRVRYDMPMSSIEPRFVFDTVLFFGRSIDEYRTMFNFAPEDYSGRRILDCAAGPAALCANAQRLGLDVLACDPMYSLPLSELQERADADARKVQSLQSGTMDLFDDAVRRAQLRRADMNDFLADFESGKQAGRYVAGKLPKLPFADNSFDLALCGNLLFLYSDTASGGMLPESDLDFDFHLKSLLELMRVTSGEARIYPLVGPEAPSHKYLQPLRAELTKNGIQTELVPVQHRDIKTATELLSLRRA